MSIAPEAKTSILSLYDPQRAARCRTTIDFLDEFIGIGWPTPITDEDSVHRHTRIYLVLQAANILHHGQYTRGATMALEVIAKSDLTAQFWCPGRSLSDVRNYDLATISHISPLVG